MIYNKAGTPNGLHNNFLFLAGAVALCLIKANSFFSTEYAFGVDGYYYASQINSYWSKGRFFAPDSSLVLLAMAWFSRLGNDIVWMNKLFGIILYFLLMLTGYRLGSLAGPSRGLFLGLWFGASSLTIRLSYEYTKNFGAMIFLVLFIIYLVKKDKNLKDRILLAVFFLAGLLSHKFTAALSVSIIVTDFIYIHSSETKHLFKKLLHSMNLYFAGAGIILTAAMAVVFYRYFPNFIHLTDTARITKEFSAAPQFPPYSLMAISGFDIPNIAEFCMHLLFFLAAAYSFKQTGTGPDESGRRMVLAAAVILAVAWFPFFKFDTLDLAYRFLLLSFIPPGIAVVVFIRTERAFPAKPAAVLFTGFMVFYGWYNDRYILSRETYSINYQTIARVEKEISLPEDALMIVHQGFDYYYCYTSHKDAFHFLPEKKHDGRPVLRMAFGVAKKEYQLYLGDETTKISFLPGYYSLLPEPLWQKFRNQLPPEKKKLYDTWRNPHAEREQFLKRNDRFKKD